MPGFPPKRRLTTSSAGVDPGPCTFPDDPHNRNPTDYPQAKKQRLIEATKVLLDVAKDSSDWFPPLKSCLGGIAALIKHYDVCSYQIIPPNPLTDSSQQIQDVKDKLEDLSPWVVKLKVSLTMVDPKDDREEAERRTQLAKFAPLLSRHDKLILCRSLDDIEKRSQALSEKGKMARVLDKSQDAQAVVRLVDQLQKSIIIYQVCSQSRRV